MGYVAMGLKLDSHENWGKNEEPANVIVGSCFSLFGPHQFVSSCEPAHLIFAAVLAFSILYAEVIGAEDEVGWLARLLVSVVQHLEFTSNT